jgi:hypothetical protein
MTQDFTTLAMAAVALAGLAIFLFAGLKAWREWIDLKRLELSAAGGRRSEARGPAAERIEMADLKERIRKLESLAACIDP